MIINNCIIKNFRSYQNSVFEFSEKLTFLRGANGCGKSNILEAIYVLSSIKSFRVTNDEPMVKWGENNYYICASVKKTGAESIFEIGYSLDERKKKVKIDKIEINTLSNYLGSFLCVVLYPGDIQLIDGPPDNRRRFFDKMISTVDPEYLILLHDMKRILKIRGTLLKNNHQKKDLENWDILLSEKCYEITKKRKSFVSEYSPIFNSIHSEISDGNFVPELIYNSELKELSKEEIFERISKNYQRDFLFKSTLFGSHRDSYTFMINKMFYSNTASQGQKRTASLSLKIAEKRIVEKKKNEKAIVLVDDIFTELDKLRRHNLISLLGEESQIIIALTDSSEIPETKEVPRILDINNVCEY
ncbi:MAG: DNA replication/repair protein RecF [Spirochaetes bacterium]|nr:DNA replication/repair protein RecF [Spirochaetota bacterium]